MYTEFVETASLAGYARLCHLRLGPDAQKEIREIAQEMIRQTMAIEGDPFHHSIRVWGLDKLV
jgi:thymidylate synthase ThyX